MQYLIPVDQSRVHPCRTFDECLTFLLDGAGVPRNRIVLDASEGEPVTEMIDGNGTTAKTVVLTSQRRLEHDLEAAYVASDYLTDALFCVKLAGYCELPSGGYARLPGDYWRNLDIRTDPDPALRVQQVEPEVPAEAIGRLILLDQDNFEAWAKGGAIAKLSAALSSGPVASRTVAPKRAPSARMRQLGAFLGLAAANLPGGSRPQTATELEAAYRKWVAAQPGGASPFATSRFKELRERWVQGERW